MQRCIECNVCLLDNCGGEHGLPCLFGFFSFGPHWACAFALIGVHDEFPSAR